MSKKSACREIPVLVVAFKRFTELDKCLQRLANVRPSRLYISVDGARSVKEHVQVEKVRALAHKIDWPCEVRTRFADRNYGCMEWVSSSISWFFENEMFGVILEEDILVDARFIEWCGEMVTARMKNPKIMQLNAFDPSTYLGFTIGTRETKYITSWGWATWRDAWAHYDGSMGEYRRVGVWEKYKKIHELLGGGSRRVSLFYALAMSLAAQGKSSSWAFRWCLSVWVNGGVAITPGVNLSENIGFGVGATHTSSEDAFSLVKTDVTGAQPASEGWGSVDANVDISVLTFVNRCARPWKLIRMGLSLLIPNKLFFRVRRFIRN